jgi:Rod binding domain-containing protein
MNVSPLSASSVISANGRPDELGVRSTVSQKLTGKALRNAEPAEQRKEVAAQFEAILVRQLLGPTMASMLGKEGGAATNVYGDMLTDAFAQQLTRGGGLGLSGMLQKQLTPRTARDHSNSSADPADPSQL